VSAISIPCIKVTQPIGEFFIGTIAATDLVAISFADVRRPDGRDIEQYIGTQRDLSEGRVAELKKYVTTIDACFPTSIILAVDSDHAAYDEKSGRLKIEREENVAKIIDGQHRIAGLEDYNGEDFEINVTIFIDMDIEDQAMVFATINLKQTKVSKSLAYDLYEYAAARSPHKTCHNVAKLLNYRTGSPLKGCIKILGKATGKELESITQATFVDRLMKLITRDAMGDKDRLKRGKRLELAQGVDERRLLLRNLFIAGEDAKIAKILWEYFSAVKARWPEAWLDRAKGAILGRTTGFAALVRLLPAATARITRGPLTKNSSLPTKTDYLALMKRIKLDDDEFTAERYLPGSTGEGQLYEDLLGDIKEVSRKWEGG
jgi:DGQHR domain-containing protein